MPKSIYSGSNENTDSEPQTQAMTSFASILSPFTAVAQPAPAVDAKMAQHYRLESVAFQHALIALAAKLSTIDGSANKAEYAACYALFIAESQMDATQARSLFVARAMDTGSAVQYARQIAGMTVGQPALHADLLQRLLQVAAADAMPNAAELELLRAVADAFGISKETFRDLMSQGFTAASASPYEVLGISAKATDKELREHYMARVQKLHPDRYHAAGASAETIAMLSDQLAATNAAYNAVQQSRAKKSSLTGVSSWLRKNTKGA